jgi:branched-chain amino acid transport system ATP-binding protein
MTVADNLRVPLIYAVNARRAPLSAVNARRAPLAAIHARRAPLAAIHAWRAPPLDDAGIAAHCEELLTLVGLADRARHYPGDLTQVDMRKLELARAMAAGPKLLFADEAMAGLSNAEINDIVALLIRLNERGITVILIEHIMRAVMSFSQRLVVLVSGRKIADGRPDEAIRDPHVERAYLGE